MKPALNVLFVACNRREYTRLALDRLVASLPPDVYLTLADNGSVDGASEVLADMAGRRPRTELVLYEKNYGRDRPRAHFLARNHRRFRYLASVNNDTYVGDNWADKFIDILDRGGRIGIIGPVDRTWGDRELCTTACGRAYYAGDHFFFSDAYWMMRADVVHSLQSRTYVRGAAFTAIAERHSGYPQYNHFAKSQELYWRDIRADGWTLACHPAVQTRFVYQDMTDKPAWHGVYAALSKRVYCLYPERYAAETGGPMRYRLGGCKGNLDTWTDEPAQVRETPAWLIEDSRSSPLAELDSGADANDFYKLNGDETMTSLFNRRWTPSYPA